MKKMRALLFLVSLGVLAALIWYSNPVAMASLIGKSSKVYVIAGLVVSLFAVSLRVVKWMVLLENVGFLELYPIQLVGMTISNFTPGKIAEPGKAVLLKIIKKMSVSASLPTIIWERMLDIVVLVGFSAFALNFLPMEPQLAYVSLASVMVFLAAIFFFLLVLNSRKFGVAFFSRIGRMPFFGGISEKFVSTFYSSGIKRRRIVLSFFITVVVWLLEGVVLYFAFLSLGIGMSLPFLSVIIAVSILIGVASFLPGGLGSFEAVMILILSGVGIESSIATAGVLMYRFLSFGISSIIGGLSFIYLSRKADLSDLSLKQIARS